MATSDRMVRGAGETYERDFFGPLIKQTEEQLKKFDELDKQINKIAESLSSMLDKADPKTVRGINDIFTATGKLNEQTVRAAKAEKARANSQKIYTELTKKQQLAAEQSLQRQRERGIKQMEREKKAAAEAARPYKQLEKALAEAKRRYQDLAAAGMAETKEGREQLKVVNDLRKQYEGINRAIGNNQFAVGRYRQELEGLRVGLRGITGLLGQFGMALGGGALVGSAIQTLRNFDEGAADMAKTLNISKDAARELSKELLNIDTRTSIGELQKIAAIGGQIGIGADEIIRFTEATDKLNVALGDEFTGGAEEITSTLGGLRNIFSDIKSQSVDTDLLRIGNALNVLGAEGSATSPVVSDFAGRIGGVGIPLGLTTDQVLGLSATLQELNVNAERGGTAVTQVLQKMAKNTKAFAKVAGLPVKEFEKLVNTDLYGAFIKVVEGSQKFGGNATDLAKILDGLKIDGAGASEIFLKLGSNTDLLSTRVDQANKSLKETDSIIDEFNTKNNTLSANVDKLRNAWDEYVISTDSATGATGKLSSLLSFVAKNLPTIISLVIKLAVSFGVYRLALIAVNIQQQIAEKGAKGFAKELFSLKKETDDTEDSMKGLGTALKGIAWTAAIALASELLTQFIDLVSGARNFRFQLDLIAKSEKYIETSRSAAGKKESERLEGVLAGLKAEAKLRGESEEAVKKSMREQVESNLINLRNKQFVAQQKLYREQTMVESAYGKVQKGNRENFLKEEKASLQSIEEKIKVNETFLATLESEADATGATIDLTEEKTEKTKKLKKATDELTASLKAQEDFMNDNALTEFEKDLGAAVRSQISAITEDGVYSLSVINRLIAAEKERRKALIESRFLERTGGRTFDAVTAIPAEITPAEQAAVDERAKAYADLEEEILNLETSTNDQLENSQIAHGEKTISEAERQHQQLLKDVDDYYDQLRLEGLKSNKTSEELAEEDLQNQIAALEEKIWIEQQYGNDTLKMEIELAELRRQLKDEEAEKDKKRIQDLKDFGEDALKEGLDAAKEASRKREALIDKEIDASQKLADALRQQANEGNAIASESLAAQDAITDQKMKQKAEEQRQQQQIEELQLLYDATQQYLDDGDSLPIAAGKALAQVKGIKALFNTAKGFFTGTKFRLGDEDKPFAPGRDGHFIRADGSEGILSGDKMDRLQAAGINSTDEITENALAFKKLTYGMIVPRIYAKSQTENNAILNEIKDMKRVIREKTEFSLQVVKNARTGLIDSMTVEERTPTMRTRTRHQTRNT